MAKGQMRSNKEVRKPKAKPPKKASVSSFARQPLGIRST